MGDFNDLMRQFQTPLSITRMSRDRLPVLLKRLLHTTFTLSPGAMPRFISGASLRIFNVFGVNDGAIHTSQLAYTRRPSSVAISAGDM